MTKSEIIKKLEDEYSLILPEEVTPLTIFNAINQHLKDILNETYAPDTEDDEVISEYQRKNSEILKLLSEWLDVDLREKGE